MTYTDFIAGLLDYGVRDAPSWPELFAACKGVRNGVIQWDEAFAEKYIGPYLVALADLEA